MADGDDNKKKGSHTLADHADGDALAHVRTT